MTARSLAVKPFLEIYENANTPGTPPKKLSFTPDLPAAVKRTRFSDDRQLMATVSDLRRENLPGLGNATNPGGGVNSGKTSGTRVFAPDDSAVLFNGTTADKAALYLRDGPVYAPAALPVPDPADFVKASAISPTGEYVALILNATPTVVRLYRKIGTAAHALVGTWTTTGTTGVRILAKDYLLITGTTNRLIRLREGLPEVTLSGLPLNGNVIHTANRVDGTYWVYFNQGNAFSIYSITVNSSGTVVLTLVVSQTIPNLYPNLVSLSTALNGSLIAVYIARGSGSDGRNVLIYQWDGSALSLRNSSTYAPWNSTGRVQFSPSGKFLAVAHEAGSSNAELWQWTGAAGLRTYSVVKSFGNVSGGYRFYGFSTSESIAHFFAANGTANGLQQPISTVSPFAVVSSIPWAPGALVQDVRDFTISPTGQTVIYVDTAGKTQGATQDGAGSYLDFRNVNGVFVNLYDRNADVFEFRGYQQHILGSVISDIQISKTGKFISYHVSDKDPGRAAGLGRFVYAIGDKQAKEFRRTGIEWEAGDRISFIAFSPHETHFVVVFENPALVWGSDVRLYKFAADGSFTKRDTDPVLFGVPAFSACATVLVAHGGPQPYTLFTHNLTTEVLDEATIPVSNWTAESAVVLDAAFSDDCNSIILATDRGPAVISTPEDGDGPEVTDDDLKDEPDEDPADDFDKDLDKIIDTGGGELVILNPGESSGEYTFTPDGGINQIAYVPYVSVSVTMRTW